MIESEPRISIIYQDRGFSLSKLDVIEKEVEIERIARELDCFFELSIPLKPSGSFLFLLLILVGFRSDGGLVVS